MTQLLAVDAPPNAVDVVPPAPGSPPRATKLPHQVLPPAVPGLPLVLSAVTAAPGNPPAPTITFTSSGRLSLKHQASMTAPAAAPPPPLRTVPAAPRRPDPLPPPAPTTRAHMSRRLPGDGLTHCPDAVMICTSIASASAGPAGVHS